MRFLVEKKLNEMHEVTDYKGYEIDVDEDQWHRIKEEGSGEIFVHILKDGKHIKVVNSLKAARDFIDKAFEEDERRRKEEEERKNMRYSIGKSYMVIDNDDGFFWIASDLNVSDYLYQKLINKLDLPNSVKFEIMLNVDNADGTGTFVLTSYEEGARYDETWHTIAFSLTDDEQGYLTDIAIRYEENKKPYAWSEYDVDNKDIKSIIDKYMQKVIKGLK